MKGVSVRSEDFGVILEKYSNEQTVFYLDPPYFLTCQYDAGFPDGFHLRMLDWLRTTDAKWVLSCKDEGTNQMESVNWKNRIGDDKKLIYVENINDEGQPKLDEYFKGFLYKMKSIKDSDKYQKKAGYSQSDVSVYKAYVNEETKRKSNLYVYRLSDENYKEIMISNIAVKVADRKVLKDRGILVEEFEKYFKAIFNG